MIADTPAGITPVTVDPGGEDKSQRAVNRPVLLVRQSVGRLAVDNSPVGSIL